MPQKLRVLALLGHLSQTFLPHHLHGELMLTETGHEGKLSKTQHEASSLFVDQSCL